MKQPMQNNLPAYKMLIEIRLLHVLKLLRLLDTDMS